ncbi:MAG: AfsR/SARP family transcriptional regulator [Acidimicrobiales bacterium]|nr:AfsR/SARP family transcriptional regulator [Acidimicrobiales bacterium]
MDTTAIRLLGPPTIVHEGRANVLAGRRYHAVLAVLGLEVGRPVAASSLIDALWEEDPPPSARKTLQGFVLRLRRRLPPGAITTEGSSYRLDLPTAAVDAVAFRQLVDGAHALDPAPALAQLEQALGLWRGAPFADLTSERFSLERTHLEERRRLAEESRCEALLCVGRVAEAALELDRLAREEPLRERRWALLMTALYRVDRQVDALRAFQRAREELVRQVGLEPGAALCALEEAILRQDPELETAGSWT